MLPEMADVLDPDQWEIEIERSEMWRIDMPSFG
jgi:hypothetical protein